MSANIYRLEEPQQPLPTPIGATLLTPEEYDDFIKIIYKITLRVPSDYGCFPEVWYLREETPADDGQVQCSDGESCAPGWFDSVLDDDLLCSGTGTRPVLIYESGLLAAGLKPGDVIEYERWGHYLSFTVLSDRLAIFNSYISNEEFDKSSNDYENSAIKERVDKWFENNKIHFC